MVVEPKIGPVSVRGLQSKDAEPVIALDARITGRRREGYLRPKLEEAIAQSGIRVSLAAEIDGRLVGFLLAKVWHGEFGGLEPVAVLDTIGVHPDWRGKKVAAALFDQLAQNLSGLGIRCLRTEVAWRDQSLLSFFQHEGFAPAARFVLEMDPTSSEARARREARVESAEA